MKKLGGLLTALVMTLALTFPGLQANAATFSDVSEDFWAVNEIERFAELGIVSGDEDGEFNPDEEITRAEAAAILVGGLGLDTTGLSANYDDVAADHDASGAIAAVTNEGIMIGYNGKFQPDATLTRAEMAVILSRVFGFEGSQEAAFSDVPSDHYAYEYINALYANDVSAGYEDNTFKPNQNVTRAEYTVLLAKAIDNEVEDNGQDEGTEDEEGSEEEEEGSEKVEGSATEVLKEAYANQLEIGSYEFDANMNFGLDLPESLFENPEDAVIAEMLKDIKATVTGKYQLDPMVLEANVDVTLAGELSTTISIPMIMTEDKMWIKMPQIPFAPLPEELDGKYIEFDMAELAELEGQPAPTIDYDLQAKLAQEMYALVIDQFGDLYTEVDVETVGVPEGIDADRAFKFELTNDNLQPFLETAVKNFFPAFLDFAAKNSEALGIPAEEIEVIKNELATFDSEEIDFELIMPEINNVLTINAFETYDVVNSDNQITFSKANLDFDLTFEGETFGIKLYFDQAISNINGEFSIDLPGEDEVISLTELEAIEVEVEDAGDEVEEEAEETEEE